MWKYKDMEIIAEDLSVDQTHLSMVVSTKMSTSNLPR